jgi:HK97 family phage major capsid protein
MASLPSGYHRNAVWVMSAATFYGTIVPLAADSNGVLVMNGIEQRFLGHKVVLDENASAKIVFGDFKDGYGFNFGSDISVEADKSVAFRAGSTVYRAMALADGAVVQGEAFVVVTKAA